MPRLDEFDSEDSEGLEGGAEDHNASLTEENSDPKPKSKRKPSGAAGNHKNGNVEDGESPKPDPDVKEEDEENDDDEDEDEDEGDPAEDQFEVEAIHGHEFRKKGKGPYVLLYNIKWKGYPVSDNTLEPEENLQDSRDLLAAYHLSIGGAPQPPHPSSVNKKRSQKKLSADVDDETPPANSKRRRTADPDSREPEIGSWVPKLSNWEKEIELIETVERDLSTGDLIIYITFTNGKRSKVKREMVHKHCPLAMLRFYEAHLNFAHTT